MSSTISFDSDYSKAEKDLETLTDYDLDLYLESFSTVLHTLREGNVLTDIHVVCKDGVSFPAHKVLLACTCPYFSKLLIPEDITVVNRDMIFMPKNVDSESLQIVLDFVYTGKLKLTKDLSKINLLLNLLDFLEVRESFKYVSEALQEVIDTRNFSTIWDLADKYDDGGLSEAVTNFICKDIQCLAKLPQFLRLPTKRLQLILNSKTLGIDYHRDILTAFLAWGKEDPERQTDLDIMLRDFRFAILSKHFLIRLMMADPVVRCSKTISFHIKRTLWDRGIRVSYFSPTDSEPAPGSKKDYEDFLIEDDPGMSSSDSCSFYSPHSVASAPIPKLPNLSHGNVERRAFRPENVHELGDERRWAFRPITFKKKKRKKVKKSKGGGTASAGEIAYSGRAVQSASHSKQKEDSTTSSSTTPRSLPADCLSQQYRLPDNPETVTQNVHRKKNKMKRPSPTFSVTSLTSAQSDGNPRRQKVILIFGRRRSGETCMQCFNLETNQWMPVKNINIDIPDNSATVYHHDGFYFLGGSDAVGNSINTCMVYNLQLNHFEKVKSMTMSRSYAHATTLERNIYVVGGIGHHLRPLSNMERFNIYSDSWQILEPLPIWLWNMAVITYQKKVLVLGGKMWRNCSLVCFSYQPERDQWTEINYLPKQFSGSYPLAAVLQHKLFVIRYANPNYIWEFDNFTNRWLRPNMEDGGPRRVLGILPYGDFLWVLDYAGKIFIYNVDSHMWVRECAFSKSLTFPMYAVIVPWPVGESHAEGPRLDWEKPHGQLELFNI